MLSRGGLVLLTVHVVLTAAQEDFSRIPENQNVDLGQEAVFHCQHRGALSIGWLIGGIPENQLNDSGMIVSSGTYRDEMNLLVYTLAILAHPEYNETVVECVATFLNFPPQTSPPATLTIEGTCGTFILTTAFTIRPILGVFADGSQVTFKCHHLKSNRIDFEIDGLPVNDSLVENPSIVRESAGNGRSTFVLKFEAMEIHDGSVIVCVASFINGCPNQETFPAFLLIQGPLSGVTRFRRLTSNQIVYSWTPPPTLDLTNVNTDVVYSIEIYNTTCGANDLLSSQNNLRVPLYQNALLDLEHVYKVVIVPRSNVPGARNGTTFIEHERFGEVNVSSVVLLENSSGVMIELALQFSMDTTSIRAKWYSLHIHSLDDEMPTVLEIDEVKRVYVLPRRQLWFASVMAYDCEQHEVGNTVISTFAVQNISVTSDAPGELEVAGDFLTNTSEVGMLAIVYSTENDSDIQYTNARLPQTEIHLTGLSGTAYSASVFVIEENGLPFNRAAHYLREINIRTGTISAQTNVSVEYELEETASCIKVICTFLMDSSATDCVAVVHQRISQLGSGGLINITSYKFNRSDDSASGCIPQVDMVQYQIGVVGGQRLTNSSGPPDRSSLDCSIHVGCIIGVIGGCLAIVVVVMEIIIVVIIFLFRRRMHNKRANLKQQPSSGNNHSTEADATGTVYFIEGREQPLPKDDEPESAGSVARKRTSRLKEPQSVSNRGSIPGIASGRPIQVENEAQPRVLSEAATSQLPPAQTGEELSSAISDYSHPEPVEETNC